MAKMAWSYVGRVAIAVHSAEPPTADEWARYVDSARDLLSEPSERLRVLVYSYGGGPDSAQRKALTDVLAKRAAPVAMLTSSLAMRGIGTAIGWFNRKLRVFALNDESSAFAYLGLTPEEAQQARACRLELEETLGLPEAAQTADR